MTEVKRSRAEHIRRSAKLSVPRPSDDFDVPLSPSSQKSKPHSRRTKSQDFPQFRAELSQMLFDELHIVQQEILQKAHRKSDPVYSSGDIQKEQNPIKIESDPLIPKNKKESTTDPVPRPKQANTESTSASVDDLIDSSDNAFMYYSRSPRVSMFSPKRDKPIKGRARARSDETKVLFETELPPRTSILFAIVHYSRICCHQLTELDTEFVQPLLGSELVQSILRMQTSEGLDFDVHSTVMPLVNVTASLKSLVFIASDDELLEMSPTDALDQTISSLTVLCSEHVSVDLIEFIASHSKLEYLLEVWTKRKSRRRSFKGTDLDQLRAPIYFLSLLMKLLNLLRLSLDREQRPDFEKYLVIVEDVVQNLRKVSYSDNWQSILRHQVISLHLSIKDSMESGMISDLLDPNMNLIVRGNIYRTSSSRIRHNVKSYRFYLFNRILIWTGEKSRRFKGSIVLSDKLSSSPSEDDPLQLDIRMPYFIESKQSILAFKFQSIHHRAMFQYFLENAIKELPKNAENTEMDRILSKRSKNVLKRHNSKSVDSRRSVVSRPFNVQHKTLVNFNMEWQGDIEDEIKLLTRVGSGGFGSVYKAIHTQSGILMAAKLVTAKDEKQEKAIRQEIDLLQMCNHPNIVSYYGCAGPDSKGQLWILMDFCAAGSLLKMRRDLQITREMKHPLGEKEIGYILCKTLLATIYLHQRNIIHRDIKAGNILISSKGDICLADFGVSKIMTSDSFNATGGVVGSAYWLPPEALREKEVVNDKSSSKDIDLLALDGDQAAIVDTGSKGDVWAIGITAIEIAEGKPPYSDISPFQAMLRILQDDPPSFSSQEIWSDLFKDFIRQCLTKDPAQRPSAAVMLQHPFVIGHLISSHTGHVMERLMGELSSIPSETPKNVESVSKMSDLSWDNLITNCKDDTELKHNSIGQGDSEVSKNGSIDHRNAIDPRILNMDVPVSPRGDMHLSQSIEEAFEDFEIGESFMVDTKELYSIPNLQKMQAERRNSNPQADI